MRYAFMLLGLMTLILFVGVLFAFSKKAEAPTGGDSDTHEERIIEFRE